MKNYQVEKNVVVLDPTINNKGVRNRVIVSLIMRSLLFAAFGGMIVGAFALFGNQSPLQAAEKWWPFQGILANIATFFILRGFFRKEGIKYSSVFTNFEKGKKKKTIFEVLWLLPVSFIAGGIPLYIFSYLFLGSITPPTLMFQEIPLWAFIIALILFPISNALVETPTYIGYALPRIKALTKMGWLAILLAGIALAAQHIVLPLVFEMDYMLWRIFSFLPFAILLGFIFTKTNRLLPIVIVHYLIDLQLIIQLGLMTLK